MPEVKVSCVTTLTEFGSLRVTLGGEPARTGDTWKCWSFNVWSGQELVASVAIKATNTAAALLGSDQVSPDQIEDAVLRWAVHRLDDTLQSRELRAALLEEEQIEWWVRSGPDAEDVRTLIGADKRCSYQVSAGRDLFCTAVSKTDDAIVGEIGGRIAAPTSRTICNRCDLPDADYLCSRFLHPQVHSEGTMSDRWGRSVLDAICDLGHSEVQEPGLCRAGGHSCWERLVPLMEEVDLSVPSPLSIAEALDFLDATWRLAFGADRHLLRLRVATEVTGLALPCSTRDEFEARMSDLADVLDSFVVDDDLVPESGQSDQDIQGSLRRMEVVLINALDPEVAARAVDALGRLRQVRRVRAGFQHSDALRELPRRLTALGVTGAPPDWGRAWDRIRQVTREALDTIRDSLRTLTG